MNQPAIAQYVPTPRHGAILTFSGLNRPLAMTVSSMKGDSWPTRLRTGTCQMYFTLFSPPVGSPEQGFMDWNMRPCYGDRSGFADTSWKPVWKYQYIQEKCIYVGQNRQRDCITRISWASSGIAGYRYMYTTGRYFPLKYVNRVQAFLSWTAIFIF